MVHSADLHSVSIFEPPCGLDRSHCVEVTSQLQWTGSQAFLLLFQQFFEIIFGVSGYTGDLLGWRDTHVDYLSL